MIESKKKILFVNDEMQMGGVARVLNTLMSSLPQDQYEIELLVLHKHGMLLKEVPQGIKIMEGTPFFRTVDESLVALVKRVDLPALCNKLRLLFYMKTGLIRKKIQKERAKMGLSGYDVEMAAKEGFCTVFTAEGDSKKKINWVLTDYSVCNYSKRHMALVKSELSKIDLNIADSQQALTAYEQVFDISGGMVIHNLMDISRVQEGMKEPTTGLRTEGKIRVISVARFHPQKGLLRLLEASQYATEMGYPHTLYLIGGGEEENKLKLFVEKNKMTHVVFLGYQQNPYNYMAACDVFALTSLYEGFATVINESLITGTPVFTTDVSGVQEQITQADYGWIVENNQEAINQGFLEVVKNPTRLKEMKKNLQHYQYPNKEILQTFIDIL